MARKPQTAVSTAYGYSRHFEARPENDLMGGLIQEVIDATTVREHAVGDLMVFKIADVFAGGDEIFIGFGRPNAYLVCPDGEGGYQKFAGKSLKRAPSVIEKTKGFAQSGLLIRLKGLPPEAAERLREAMQHFHGNKYWTCVNACMRVMQRAGFKSGKRPLDVRYWPYSLFTSLVNDGLTFDGKPVEFDVIRTTPDRIERYAMRIIGAEVTTFCRHCERNLMLKAKAGSKRAKFMLGVISLPSRLVGGGPRKANRNTAPVAPPLPDNVEYLREIDMQVSEASKLGAIMRLFWGAHNLFEGSQTRVDVEKYQSEPLKPFPQAKPNLATRAKKAVLFSRPVIWLMRKILVPRYTAMAAQRSERDIYNALRTHCEDNPNMYNLVVLKKRNSAGRIVTTVIVARITGGAKLLDWILSKHVLMAAYSAFTFFAGEIWKDENGVIHFNRNSGTFQPTAEQAAAMEVFFQETFPNLQVVNDPI